MGPTLEQVCCASLPATALAVLADLRRSGGIRVTLAGERAWVRWRVESDAVLERVFPVPGVELFERRDGRWYRPGHHLPAFDVPLRDDDEGQALGSVLVPDRIVAPPPGRMSAPPARFRLVRDDRARASSALTCGLDLLAHWAETATTVQIAALSAARDDDRVLVMGRNLPPLTGGERLWGTRVLVPLGYRPEPDLSERALRRVFEVEQDTLLWLRADGVEFVPDEAFRPLSRAGIRLAGARAS